MTNKELQEELKKYDDDVVINLHLSQCVTDMGYYEFEALLKEIQKYPTYLYLCGTEKN